jgi:hypothetical protein
MLLSGPVIGITAWVTFAEMNGQFYGMVYSTPPGKRVRHRSVMSRREDEGKQTVSPRGFRQLCMPSVYLTYVYPVLLINNALNLSSIEADVSMLSME